MIIDSVILLVQIKKMSETPFHYFALTAPILIFLFERYCHEKNIFIAKNKVLKLFLHILLLISLVYAFRCYRSFLVKGLYGTFIIVALIMFVDTLRDIFNIKNAFINWFYKILVKLSSILLLPLMIKNALLYKLYNIDINREELPYVNICLIQVFTLQWVIASIFIFSDMENFFNKYFFGFAIGTFISYFSIDIIIMLTGSNDKNVERYRFVAKKSFLIVLMIELIVIAFMANIDYHIISKWEIIRIFKLNKPALKELFDSITLCTLVLQLLEYRNTQK